MAAKRIGELPETGLEEAPPHYHGHRERLRGRFREAGADAVSDYELLELVLFRALPRRDVKPLAKALIEKFGSFAEVIAAPPQRLDADELIERLRHVASRNFEALVRLAPTSFATEADFFHGDLSEERFGHYERFCRQQVIKPSERPPRGAPYQLCLARYANSYFGVAQCAQLDSLRAAIDEISPDATPERDLLLSALLMAASVCSTGPHFAQPRKLTMASFRDTVERRARSVIWEFELAVRRMAARPPLRHPIESASQGDWREAVTHFARGPGERRPAAVYFDPPYSKFQYSRYYHLLNVLISYDYPSIHGVGRYPPLADRFSSRFEHRANPALSEFEDAFDLCRDLGLRVFVSYSNRGLVAADALVHTISRRFAEVVEFSDRIQHHSQGTRLGDHLGYVTEFVLAARND